MNQRQIKAAIYMSGIRDEYRVHHNLPGLAIVCYVPTVAIGNAIVRALRQLASDTTKPATKRARSR